MAKAEAAIKRPREWENPFSGSIFKGFERTFEDGADAMLRALLRGAVFVTFGVRAAADDTMVKVALPNEPGFWVMIPAEFIEGGEDGGQNS